MIENTHKQQVSEVKKKFHFLFRKIHSRNKG